MSSNYAKAQSTRFNRYSRSIQTEKILSPKGLVAVVGVKTKPLYDLEETIENTIDEAKQYYEAGIRNIMIQNVKDVPFLDSGNFETTSAMTVICQSTRKAMPDDCILGLSMMKDNGEALVAVASATSMDYIRPKCYVGSVVSHDGVHNGIINEVLETRTRLSSDVEIIPDIFDRTSTKLGNTSLAEAISWATSFGLCNSVILTGKSFKESVAMAKEAKEAFPDLYIYLGGGANHGNLKEAYEIFDGIFVSSCLKDSSNMTGKLDKDKLEAFMDIYEKIAR